MTSPLKSRSQTVRRDAVINMAMSTPAKKQSLYRQLSCYPPYRTIGKRPARHNMGQAMKKHMANQVIDALLPGMDWDEVAQRFMAEVVASKVSGGALSFRTFTYRAIAEFFNRPNVKVRYNRKARSK